MSAPNLERVIAQTLAPVERIDPVDIAGRKEGLSYYDAAYLALAIEQKAGLLTADDKLRNGVCRRALACRDGTSCRSLRHVDVAARRVLGLMNRSFTVWDLGIAAGLALVIVSLALPWQEERTCGPMQECTAWTMETGWSSIGWGAGAGAFLLALAFAGLPAQGPRIASLVVALLGILALTMDRLSQNLRIFVETHGPETGVYVAWAGALVILVTALAGMVAASRTTLPATPT